jgi:para-aminobenzoate synthetase component I
VTLPFCQELDPRLEVCDALDAVADWPFVVLLDSAGRSNERCRYSFLTADPWQRWIQPTSLTRHDPFAGPRTEWLRFRCDPISGLPPFQGGAIAMLAYELGCALEPWQPAGCDPFQLPSLAAGLFDWVIAWDHHRGQVWLISQGFPETEPAARTARARERAAAVIERLASIPSSPSASASRGQGHLTTAPHHSSAIPEGHWSQLDESIFAARNTKQPSAKPSRRFVAGKSSKRISHNDCSYRCPRTGARCIARSAA